MSTYEWTVLVLSSPIVLLFTVAAILEARDQSPEAKERRARFHGYYEPNYFRQRDEERT